MVGNTTTAESRLTNKRRTMKLLIACPRKLLLLDTESAKHQVVESHRPEYYGITWDESGRDLILGHSGIENSSLLSLESYVESERGWVSYGQQRGTICPIGDSSDPFRRRSPDRDQHWAKLHHCFPNR